jgi:diguanylate cyclase (GGDEF)-like protein
VATDDVSEGLTGSAADNSTPASDIRSSILDGLPEAVVAVDDDLVIRYANEMASQKLTADASTLSGTPLIEFFSTRSGRRLIAQIARSELEGSRRTELDATLYEGTPVRLRLQTAPDSSTGLRTGVIEDISSLRGYESQVDDLSPHDPLTGLMNRRSFIRQADRVLLTATDADEPCALLLVDLDRFKELNDVAGHQYGDVVLVRVAQALSDAVPTTVLVGRVGGDRFGIFATSLGADDAQSLSGTVVEAIAALSVSQQGHLVRVSASIGVALLPDHGDAMTELLASAEEAVRRAKGAGGNRVSMVDPADDWRGEEVRIHTWIERVELAAKEGRLVPYAQPIRKSGEEAIRKFELLIRMFGDDGESVPPDDFLEAVEHSGMSLELDLMMLRSACELIAGFADANLQLNVNVTPTSFADPEMPGRVQAIITEAEIEPGALGLEITENAVISDIGAARSALEDFKALGCRIVLDDFGSGFSSFYHLRSLPFDELKIDGLYVVEILEHQEDAHFVTAMVTLADGLGMETTAEYVYTAKHLAMLEELGVDYCQGFAVGRPGPAWELVSETLD